MHITPTHRAFDAADAALADYRERRAETEGNISLALFHVERMKLNKEKTAVKINDALTLSGIPPEAFAYRLGNRSALDWVLDQYQKSTDARSGITSDPNRPDDPEYIVRLIGKVVTVSVETVQIIANLPGLPAPVGITSEG